MDLCGADLVTIEHRRWDGCAGMQQGVATSAEVAAGNGKEKSENVARTRVKQGADKHYICEDLIQVKGVVA